MVEVEYELTGMTNPIGVAEYKFRKQLPAKLKGEYPALIVSLTFLATTIIIVATSSTNEESLKLKARFKYSPLAGIESFFYKSLPQTFNSFGIDLPLI